MLVTRNKVKSSATFHTSWLVDGSGRVQEGEYISGSGRVGHDFRA